MQRVVVSILTSNLSPCLCGCVFLSVSQFAAGGNGRVVVERGVQAVQVSHCAELLPQRVPGPAHHPGATPGSKLMSCQGREKFVNTGTLHSPSEIPFIQLHMCAHGIYITVL